MWRCSILQQCHWKNTFWGFHSRTHIKGCLPRGAGTPQTDSSLSEREMQPSEYFDVRQADGSGYQREWHLSRCTSGLESQRSPRATCGFDRSYMLQGRPLPVRRIPASPRPHLESCWMPPQQAQLDPLIVLVVVFLPSSRRGSFGRLWVAVMSSASNVLRCWGSDSGSAEATRAEQEPRQAEGCYFALVSVLTPPDSTQQMSRFERQDH